MSMLFSVVNDPVTGVMRHVDAGYERARDVAAERSVRIPMAEGPDPHGGRTADGA